MTEFNQESARSDEQDQSHSNSTKAVDELRDVAAKQWQVEKIVKLTGADPSQDSLNKEKLAEVINKAERNHSGLAKLTKEEVQIAREIYKKYDKIKELHKDGILPGLILPEFELSPKDLKLFVANKTENERMENEFEAQLRALDLAGQMNTNHQKDRTKFHCVDDILKAMSRGDSTGLKEVLDHYRYREDLTDLTHEAHKIVMDKGGNIEFRKDNAGHPYFAEVVFPGANSQPKHTLTNKAIALQIVPADKEPPIAYTDDDKIVRNPQKMTRSERRAFNKFFR